MAKKQTTDTQSLNEVEAFVAAPVATAAEMSQRLPPEDLARHSAATAAEIAVTCSAERPPLPNARIAAAIVKAQRGFRTAIKDADNPFFKSKYATLGDCWDAVKDALADAGLAVLQPTTCDEQGRVCVATQIIHESGETMTSLYPVVCAKERDPQAMGSAITYARRYALSAFLGIIADTDDDGEAATIHTVTPAPARKPAPPPPPATEDELAILDVELADCTSRAEFENFFLKHRARYGKDPRFLEICKAAATRFPKS